MGRLLLSLVLFLFVTLPLTFASIGLTIETLRGKMPKNDPTALPVVLGLSVLTPLSAYCAWRLFSSWKKKRTPNPDPRGFWERQAEKNPALFERAFSLNGFGLRYLDAQKREADGAVTMTLWLTAAFFPVAPVRRERLQIQTDTRQRGVPFLLWWDTTQLRSLEQMPVERGRSLRVYGFYYLLFLPLIVAPFVAGFAYMVADHFKGPAWLFWTALLGCLVWGIGVVFFERRVMGIPNR